MLPKLAPFSAATSTESGSSACSRNGARAAAGLEASMMPFLEAPERGLVRRGRQRRASKAAQA